MVPGSAWNLIRASSLLPSAPCPRRFEASAEAETFWSCWGYGVRKTRSPLACNFGILLCFV